jgi:hypothetical protein
VLGWSAILGVGVVLITYVLNYPLAKYNIYVRSHFIIGGDVGTDWL